MDEDMKRSSEVRKEISLSEQHKPSHELVWQLDQGQLQEFVECKDDWDESVNTEEDVEFHSVIPSLVSLNLDEAVSLDALHSCAPGPEVQASSTEDQALRVHDTAEQGSEVKSKCYLITGWDDDNDLVEDESVTSSWNCSPQICPLLWDAEDFLALRLPVCEEEPFHPHVDDENATSDSSSSEVFHSYF
ncbi:hypothetical protein GWK47_029760 [Chionoecetes opilio]|uniref:Uncharacterized protein n=1 Tax=Chionoecetes opilio TaxID=41210 RepID=A0A8J4YM34_CHIOP|nr:hypothetical protein GWK47_029760 [Chionoecetes opilio]